MTERITPAEVREYVRWFQANYAPVPWLERLADQMELDELRRHAELKDTRLMLAALLQGQGGTIRVSRQDQITVANDAIIHRYTESRTGDAIFSLSKPESKEGANA